MTAEYQNHSGSVNTSTTPAVQYAYSEMSGGTNHSRLTSVTYPDGYTVSYEYASGLDSNISRLTRLVNGSTTLEEYTYLGLGSVVKRAHPQSGVDLTYIGSGTGDGGEERLYVAQDANWNDTALINTSGAAVERIVYDPYGKPSFMDSAGADRMPNASSFDWAYLHQGLRLDSVVDLYDNRARVYSATLMRFLQNDPIGFAAGDGNTYRYEGNGSIGATDASGLCYSIILGLFFGPKKEGNSAPAPPPNTPCEAYGGMSPYRPPAPGTFRPLFPGFSSCEQYGGPNGYAGIGRFGPQGTPSTARSTSLPCTPGPRYPYTPSVSAAPPKCTTCAPYYDWHDPNTGYRANDPLWFVIITSAFRGLDFYACSFGGIAIPGSGVGPRRVIRRAGMAGGSSWGNSSKLQDHYDRHGGDFGSRCPGDYANLGSRFLQEALARGLPSFVDSAGAIRIYDPVTNTFGAYNPDGTTRTLFKPRPGYWDRQIQKYQCGP